MNFDKKSKIVTDALRACRRYFLFAAAFSLAINLLYLASPLYMLQIYDRVVTSGSETTLVMLTLVLLAAFLALAGLDLVRAAILTRASARLDRLLSAKILAASVETPSQGASQSQSIRDFDTFRQVITGSGIHALFDLPWSPIYIGIIFLLHSWLGFFALGSSLLLIAMAVLNEYMVRAPLKQANDLATANYNFTEMSLRNAEVVRAMGMIDGLVRRWGRDRGLALKQQGQASDRAALMSGLIRFLRLTMQSLILGLGAYLVIERQITGGSMFAASLLLGRGLQPIEQIVGLWRSLILARAALARVEKLLDGGAQNERSFNLPKPTGKIAVEQLSFAIPSLQKVLLRDVSFRLEAGEALGIVGPSGAGKSTLARHLAGIMQPSRGTVRLDGADLTQWGREALGDHIGYLPQDIELFSDTVAANIGRFKSDVDREVIEAARLAGVHEMIIRLPQGYETQIGEGGAVLSGGYRQRIALARAVFGMPNLIVLDEPSSNLDSDGDRALAECALELKRRGSTVIIVSHRPSTLANVDKILLLRDGAVEAFGMKNEIVALLNQRAAPIAVATQ
ncbi:type I secretion system permease/ATPase [Mesorhizobium sp. M1C.F.Ca.ET.193.01.1.1]|uniref:type I secretion system permease/ATPase n=1 Tax=unclassified Mesorhizobium TaxID=325217 RepID=UPI000FD5D55F|nr:MULTISPECIES: type I secretion system permease/ATPase [unclassified Mesorhizobium]TGS96335.1 type I secretion system permease/ATPase [bacterium M00.F.Ca.ET.177.01.1.1]TGQ52125.1 type I secretion system permease/ATPase [Mesorhizobium sp. M1C.F.Ca.ET.210.01.1.1]TGQ68770.1 type I secretion system permease/ATPase [Mesorhizobium sp. M1C.F.Ca.ET.212.01.1.1]TGR04067.1 type I secretion system permease/ATPase [Mesorhizobium sp. M1C.F.Ca.ET.204.01.1.1]TGR24731.1 type I secretion system permease/ATPas